MRLNLVLIFLQSLFILHRLEIAPQAYNLIAHEGKQDKEQSSSEPVVVLVLVQRV